MISVLTQDDREVDRDGNRMNPQDYHNGEQAFAAGTREKFGNYITHKQQKHTLKVLILRD